jgi:hypothetical protein
MSGCSRKVVIFVTIRFKEAIGFIRYTHSYQSAVEKVNKYEEFYSY